MQDLIFDVIRRTAEQLGLPEGRVMTEGKDNLTVPRPRIEVQFMGEVYRSEVKTIGITRFKNENDNFQELKKQVYIVREQAGLNVLAEDSAWLKSFCSGLIAEMPRGVNDTLGNWVKIRIESAEGKTSPEKRVGTTSIKVLSKVGKFLVVTFEGRIAVTEQARLFETVSINLPSVRQR